MVKSRWFIKVLTIDLDAANYEKLFMFSSLAGHSTRNVNFHHRYGTIPPQIKFHHSLDGTVRLLVGTIRLKRMHILISINSRSCYEVDNQL